MWVEDYEWEIQEGIEELDEGARIVVTMTGTQDKQEVRLVLDKHDIRTLTEIISDFRGW